MRKGDRLRKGQISVLVFFVLSVLFVLFSEYVNAYEYGCCVVSKAGDRCLNNYPKDSCVSDFFNSGQDCSEVNSCQYGCCLDSCSESYKYECGGIFDSTVDSCSYVDSCKGACMYYSLKPNLCGDLSPCYGNDQSCNQTFNSRDFMLCSVDSTKDYYSCYTDVPPAIVRSKISGKVSSGSTGLNNVYVYLSTGLSNYTDASGNYIINNAPSGNYKMFASKIGYKPGEQTVEINSADEIVDFSLISKNINVINGFVKNGSRVMPRTTVKFSSTENKKTYFFVTDDNGHYEYEDISNGVYNDIFIYLQGNVAVKPLESPVTIPYTGQLNLTFGSTVSDTGSLSNVKIYGCINDTDNNNVTGASVVLMRRDGTVAGKQNLTNTRANNLAFPRNPEDGCYVLNGIISGGYYLFVTKAGYITKMSPEFYVYSDNVEQNMTLQKNLENVLEDDNKGNLTVFVYGCENTECLPNSRNSLSDARVLLFIKKDGVRFGYNFPKITDRNGRTIFEDVKLNLEDGETYEIEVMKMRYTPKIVDSVDSSKKVGIIFSNDEKNAKNKIIGSDKSLYLIRERSFIFNGVVYESNDCSNPTLSKTPISDFNVYIPDAGLKATGLTNSKGSFSILEVPSGSFTLEAIYDKSISPDGKVYSKVRKPININLSINSCAGYVCTSEVTDICVEPDSCSVSAIKSNPNFKPSILGSGQINHPDGLSPVELGLKIKSSDRMYDSATNPNGCVIEESKIFYCEDCEYFDLETNEFLDITEGWDWTAIDLEEDGKLVLNSDFTTDGSVFDAASFKSTAEKEVSVKKEQDYCFIVSHTYESTDIDPLEPTKYQLVTKLSNIVCTYSGVKPCLEGKTEFCFSSDDAPGLDYTFSMANSDYIGKCENNNSVVEFTRCSAGKKCYVNPSGRAQCIYENKCLNCSSSFGVFDFEPKLIEDGAIKNCQEGEYQYVCFRDRNVLSSINKKNELGSNDFKSSVDIYKSCNMISSCYDYKSSYACENNVCLGPRGLDCSWEDSDLNSFGDGVCVPDEEEYQDCSRCHDPTNRFFGLCDEDRCEMFGTNIGTDENPLSSCYYRYTPINKNAGIDSSGVPKNIGTNLTRDINYRCVNRRDVACEDYNDETDCRGTSGNSDIEPLYIPSSGLNDFKIGKFSTNNKDNSKSVPSGDRFNLGNCKWVPKTSGGESLFAHENFEGFCIKDADGTSSTINQVLSPYNIYSNFGTTQNKNDCGSWSSIRAWINGVSEQSIRNHDCSLDNFPPITSLVKFMPKFKGTPSLKLPFSITDNDRKIKQGMELNAILLNSTPLTNEWGERKPEGFGALAIPESKNFMAGNKMILDFNHVPTGFYNVFYFTRDTSNNLEVLKTEEIEVVSSAPGVYIDWDFTSEEIDSGATFSRYISALKIDVHTVRDAQVTCHSYLVNDEDEPIGDDVNPMPWDDGSTGSSWSVLFKGLSDGTYTFKIFCINDMGLYTANYSVNSESENNYYIAALPEVGKRELVGTINVVINTDRNMRLSPKLHTVMAKNEEIFSVYTALENSICKINKANVVDDITPLGDGGFLDTTSFNAWGTPFSSQTNINEEITEDGQSILMKKRFDFRVGISNVEQNTPQYYYVWCKYILSNGDEKFSEISNLNRFTLYVDSNAPNVYLQDEVDRYSISKPFFDTTQWISSETYSRLNIRCIDSGDYGYEFGSTNTRENMTLCVEDTCVSGMNQYNLFSFYPTDLPFDISYSCLDRYESGPKNMFDYETKSIKLDSVQPSIYGFNASTNQNVKKNSCGYYVIAAPIGNEVSYFPLEIKINDFVIDEKDRLLQSNKEFTEFELRANLLNNFQKSANSVNLYFLSDSSGIGYRLLVSDQSVVLYGAGSSELGYYEFDRSIYGLGLVPLSISVKDENGVNNITISFNEKTIISVINSDYNSGKIFFEEDGILIESSGFGIISKSLSAPIDDVRSQYKIGMNGQSKFGLMKDSERGDSLYLLLTSDNLVKNSVNEVFFRILDKARVLSEADYDYNNFFELLVDSEVPELTPTQVYTTEDTQGLGSPRYDISEDKITVEYDLETVLELSLEDPNACFGAGADWNKIYVKAATETSGGWDSNLVPILNKNETTGILKLDITELTKTLGGNKQISINITDLVGNSELYIYNIFVNDTMGPRLKMDLVINHQNEELSHNDVSPLMGVGKYEFCFSTNADDINKETFEIKPKLPYIIVNNFDKTSMCGNLTIVHGTEYSRTQLPLDFQVVVKDYSETKGGMNVKLKIDTMQPPAAEIVPSFKEQENNLIDKIYEYLYPVELVIDGSRKNDPSLVYTNLKNLTITGYVPQGATFLRYKDSEGEKDLRNYVEQNNKINIEKIVFNVSRDSSIGSKELFLDGEKKDLMNSIALSNGNKLYILFKRGSESFYRRAYPDYGKMYEFESVSDTYNDNMLYDETLLKLTSELEFDVKEGDVMEFYDSESLSRLFRINVSLVENGITPFYIKSINDVHTETYIKPLYNIIMDNISPIILVNTFYPPVGTFNKNNASISFNVTDALSGININGVDIKLNGVLVDKSYVSITSSADNPNYKVEYNPPENIEDGEYVVEVLVRDRAGNMDSHRYEFTMASEAPDFPRIVVSSEVYNDGFGRSWIKDHSFSVDILFEDDLNVSIVSIERSSLDSSSFTRITPIVNLSRNRFGFDGTLHNINDQYVYDFTYRIKAYRTFNDGEKSPVGTYIIHVIYDKVAPILKLQDEGRVIRFAPNSIYNMLMNVENENYNLRVNLAIPDILSENYQEIELLEGKESTYYLSDFESNANIVAVDMSKVPPTAVIDIDGVTMSVEEGKKYNFSTSEIIVSRITQSDYGVGHVILNVSDPLPESYISENMWAYIIDEISQKNTLYRSEYGISSKLPYDVVLPIRVNVSDVAGNYILKDLRFIVDTIGPRFEIINVTVKRDANNSEVLTKESYDQMNYWTSDSTVRIVGKMNTPDISNIVAFNQVLNMLYYANIDYSTQQFYIDVELKGEDKKEELNSIIMNVSDEVGNRDISGLFVERDLLPPDLKNIFVEFR